MPSQTDDLLLGYMDGARSTLAAVLHNVDRMTPDKIVAWLKDELQRLGDAPLPAAKYALVEIMGHRRHVGVIEEVTTVGVQMLKVTDCQTGKVHLYSGPSIYGITEMGHDEYERHRRMYGQRALPGMEWSAAEAINQAVRVRPVEDIDEELQGLTRVEEIPPHMLDVGDRF
jgi:hypothetical protein